MHTLPTIAAGLATSLLSLSAAAQIDCSALSAAVMPLPVQVNNVALANSRVNPQINQRHIFCGEINAGGNAVGFHSQPLGHVPTQVNPPGAPAAPAAAAAVAAASVVWVAAEAAAADWCRRRARSSDRVPCQAAVPSSVARWPASRTACPTPSAASSIPQ